MKNKTSILSALAISITVLVVAGCKKEKLDTGNPVVVVNGLSTCYLQKGRQYVDASATAHDDVDGTLKVKSTYDINPSVIGQYTVTYTATDLSGNSGTAARTVFVVDVEGQYTNALNIKPFPTLLSADSTNFNDYLFLSIDMRGQLNFSTFGNNAGGAIASYLTSGSGLTVPSQTVNCGNPAIDRTFSGSGTINNTYAPHTIITINYTEVSDTTYHGRAVYIKD